MTSPNAPNRKMSQRLMAGISRISWRDLAASLGPVLLASALAIALAFHFVQPAPPRSINISAGPEGSQFRAIAERYKAKLARNGVTLYVLGSEGSLDNLQRLANPDVPVQVGFVQGGLATGTDISSLESLGSVFYEPVAIFYRGRAGMQRLSELKGKRVAIGPEGSGTRSLALVLLKANGIEPGGDTQLLELSGDRANQALLKNQVDAAFIMSDSSGPGTLRQMLKQKGIHLFEFPQADGYTRRFRYLSKLEIPAGAFDLGVNVPDKPLVMMAPTVELVARNDLHPALSDLLIEAAREVHGRATVLQKAGDFPAPLEHEYPISDEASRYYKSGKSFVYKHLPFWLASLTDRLLALLVPIIIVLIPGLRLVPVLYGWRIRSRIYRRYGELMALERASLDPLTPELRVELLAQLDEIEKSAITGKAPGAFADQVFVLRQHIKFVRERLSGATVTSGSVPVGS